ncbi:MAG: hypothetical protein V3S25_11515 [Nitrospirales bacterium]
MRKVLDRTVQPISLQPMSNEKGLVMMIHGEPPAGDTMVALSLQEASLLAYGLLAEAARQA